jgi:hypothetical protein
MFIFLFFVQKFLSALSISLSTSFSPTNCIYFPSP